MYLEKVTEFYKENVVESENAQMVIAYLKEHIVYLIIPLLILPLIMSFWIGKRSANRAKYFSVKLKKSKIHIGEIKNTSRVLKEREVTLMFAQRVYIIFTGFIFTILIFDYFLLNKVILEHVLDIDTNIVLFNPRGMDYETGLKVFGFLGMVIIGILLKLLIRYIRNKNKLIAKKIETEQRVISNLIAKFMDGLGSNFKAIVKNYLEQEHKNQLKALQTHSDNLEVQFETEQPENRNLKNIKEFYEKVYRAIKDFKWCKFCMNQIKNKRENPLANHRRTRTIYNTTLLHSKSTSKNGDDADKKSKGEISEINCSRPMSDINNNLLNENLGSDNDNKNTVMGEGIVCGRLCLKKLFQHVLDMKRQFEDFPTYQD